MISRKTAAFAAALCMAAGLVSCSAGASPEETPPAPEVTATEAAEETDAAEPTDEAVPTEKETEPPTEPVTLPDPTYCSADGTGFSTGVFKFSIAGEDIRVIEAEEMTLLGGDGDFYVTFVPKDSSSDLHTRVSIQGSAPTHLPASSYKEGEISYYSEILDSMESEDVKIGNLEGFHIYGHYPQTDSLLHFYQVSTKDGSQLVIGTTGIDSESEEWCDGIIGQLSSTLEYTEITEPRTFESDIFSVKENDSWFLYYEDKDEENKTADVSYFTTEDALESQSMSFTSFFSDSSDGRRDAAGEAEDLKAAYEGSDIIKEEKDITFRDYPAKWFRLEAGTNISEYTFVDLPGATFGIFTNIDNSDPDRYKKIKEGSDALIDSVVIK